MKSYLVAFYSWQTFIFIFHFLIKYSGSLWLKFKELLCIIFTTNLVANVSKCDLNTLL